MWLCLKLILHSNRLPSKDKNNFYIIWNINDKRNDKQVIEIKTSNVFWMFNLSLCRVLGKLNKF